MKVSTKDFGNALTLGEQVRKITYSDGGTAYVFKKAKPNAQNAPTPRRSFPPVNRNEPMTKTAYRRTLNRYFERLIELDLESEKCLSVTLTIRNEKYNTYDKICDRFKHFADEVRFSKKVGKSYLGAVRFIEVQERGFFHIHCILVFDNANIKLTWKDLYRMWGWGYVRVTPVYYLIGLIDYLTNIKHGVDSNPNNKFTRYPKGAKIIYISPNLPKCKSENISISADECAALLRSEKYVGHLKAHPYWDTSTQKIRFSIDKMVLVQILNKEVENKK